MKVIVTKNLNIRSGAPYIMDNNNVTYYQPGLPIEYDSYVIGQSIEGNSAWYKISNSNNYAWSGGTDGIIKLSQPDTDITAPTFDQLFDIILKKYCINNIPGVIGFGKGYQNNNYCLHLNLVDLPSKSNILSSYSVVLPNGTVKIVPSDVYITGTPRNSAGPPEPGWGVQNKTKVNGVGTFGCVVIDTNTPPKQFLLSCMHVLCGDTNYSYIDSNDTDIMDVKSGTKIADLFQGLRTSTIDAAIASLVNLNSNNAIKSPFNSNSRAVTNIDLQNKIPVVLTGFEIYLPNHIATRQTGIIYSYNFSAILTYRDGPWQINGLIVLTQPDSKGIPQTLTTPGYSGSLVMDANNNPIGLVVGGDDLFTYIIPMDTILNQFNVTILQK